MGAILIRETDKIVVWMRVVNYKLMHFACYSHFSDDILRRNKNPIWIFQWKAFIELMSVDDGDGTELLISI